MSYVGNKPPQETVMPDDSVTSAMIVDGAIVNDDVNASAAIALSKLATSWQSVVTASTFTAVAGNSYPINTTSNTCTVTLPASASVGDTIEFMDYARYWGSNAVTINPNSLNYQGNSSPNPVYDTAGESLRIVYADATKGWVPVFDGAVALETPQVSDFTWLVIAGGGGGGCGTAASDRRAGGGGGAGGYRNSFASEASGGGASTETPITGMAEGIVLTATIGAGGAGRTSADGDGAAGVDSSLIGTGISITSAGGAGGSGNTGGGGGGGHGNDGGSGSGGGASGHGSEPGGSGTSNQGYDGSAGNSDRGGGGGGAAANAGAGTGTTGGAGGAGLNNTITGASVGRSGGGGGGGSAAGGAATHGGGAGGSSGSEEGVNATANTGGGGGGQGDGTTFTAGNGGSGVVIIRILTASYSGTVTGSPTVTTDGLYTVITFTGTGTYTT